MGHNDDNFIYTHPGGDMLFRPLVVGEVTASAGFDPAKQFQQRWAAIVAAAEGKYGGSHTVINMNRLLDDASNYSRKSTGHIAPFVEEMCALLGATVDDYSRVYRTVYLNAARADALYLEQNPQSNNGTQMRMLLDAITAAGFRPDEKGRLPDALFEEIGMTRQQFDALSQAAAVRDKSFQPVQQV